MTEANVKAIVAKRKGHKAYGTKLMNEASGLMQEVQARHRVSLMALSKSLSERCEIISTLDDQVLDALTDEKAIEAEIETSGDYRTKMQKTLLELSDAIEEMSLEDSSGKKSPSTTGKMKDTMMRIKTEHVSENEDGSNSGILNLERIGSSFAKLPKLSLKTFSGDVVQYQEFWESFNSAVHGKASLDKVTKFNYLRSLLHSQAAATIGGLALTAENYDEAINLLQARYGNKQVLISAHFDKLLGLSIVHSSNDTRKLREIHDCIEVNVRSLKSLDVPSTHYGPIMVSIVMSKLPQDIKLIISRAMAKATSEQNDDEWKIDELIKAIKHEVESREMCNLVASSSFENKQKKVQNCDEFTASALVAESSGWTPTCTYCGKGHQSSRCDVVTGIASRKSIIRSKRLCYLCLKGFHRARECPSQYKCAKCKGRHHVSICDPKSDSRRDEKQPRDNEGTKKVSMTVVRNKCSSVFLKTA